VRVGVQGLRRRGVPEPGLHRLDRLAVADGYVARRSTEYVEMIDHGGDFAGLCEDALAALEAWERSR
jgi:hypothetical protein